MRLADLLLSEAPDSDGRFSQGRSVSAGLYHRHKLGLRRLCTSHPQSVRALNSFVTFLAPDHFYSSLVLIDGIASEAHCDVANAALPMSRGNKVMVNTNPDTPLQIRTHSGLGVFGQLQ